MCVDLSLGFLFWGTPIFISRRALSSTDKVTCTPRVLIPSNSSALALHSCMLSGCPCVCVCVCPRIDPGAGYSWSVLYSMHLFLVSVSVFLPITVSIGIAPVPLGPSFSLVPWPSRLSAYVPSSLPFIPLSPLFSFLLLVPSSSFSFLLPLSPSPSITPSPLFLLFFLCLSLSACLYINISLQHCWCLCSNNPISSQTTSQALKAS